MDTTGFSYKSNAQRKKDEQELHIRLNLQTIADHYGLEAQKRKCVEELSELITAISRNDRDNIIEEMADVSLMILQLEYLMECAGTVEGIMANKAERTLRRMREGK